MTKIEMLRNKLLSYKSLCLRHGRGYAWATCNCGDTTLETTLESYAQAVRDEDFAIHMAEKKCCAGDDIGCESCPAAGTRYCP